MNLNTFYPAYYIFNKNFVNIDSNSNVFFMNLANNNLTGLLNPSSTNFSLQSYFSYI